MKQLLTILFFFLMPLFMVAQDAASSLFYLNKLYLNPAYAGINRDLNFSVSHRNQWTGVSSHFTTYHASMDVGIPCRGLGVGLNMYMNEEGEGFLKTLHSSLSLASHQPLGDDVVLSLALKFGVGQKSIDWSRFTFSDQIDPIYGVIYPTSATPPLEASDLILDAAAGTVLRAKWGGRSNSFSSFGASIHHANEPVESLMGYETKLPRKFTFHTFHHFKVGSRFNPNAPQYLSAGLIYEKQAQLSTLNFGTSAAFGSNILIGLWYRSQNFAITNLNRDALIFSFNTFINKLVIGYTYDMTISQLGLNESKGTHELSLKIIIPDAFFCSGGRSRSNFDCYIFDMGKVSRKVGQNGRRWASGDNPWIYILP